MRTTVVEVVRLRAIVSTEVHSLGRGMAERMKREKGGERGREGEREREREREIMKYSILTLFY